MFADPIACPGCRAKLRRDPALDPGAAVRCPRCGRDFALPGEPPSIQRLPPPMLVPPSRQAPPPGQADPAWRFDNQEVVSSGIEDLDGAIYSVEINRWFGDANSHWIDLTRAFVPFVILCGMAAMLIVGLVPVVGPLAAMLFLFPMSQGPMIVALAIVERRPWSFSQMFGGFAWLPALLGFHGVVGVLTAACVVPAFRLVDWLESPMRPNPPRVDPVVRELLMYGVLFTVPCMLAALHARLATFGPQLILDRNCGPLAAIQGCWRLSRGHFWGLFGFNLLLGVINLAGVVCCFVGLFVTLPLTQLAAASAYLHAVGRIRTEGVDLHR